MRILLLANNWVGLAIAKYLHGCHENIVALGIPEKDKQKFTNEIIRSAAVSKKNVFTASKLLNSDFVRALAPDIIIAAFWGYILKPDVISIPPKGCINFHPGYLPYNRGMNPNVWPFVERTPAGVTLHYMNPGIDAGDIIARQKVPITPIDTAGSLYDKTLVAIVDLFKKEWPKIKAGKNKRVKQRGNTTFHFAAEVASLDELDLHKRFVARDLINLLRARSYSNHFFSFYKDKGKKVYIRVQLSYEDT